MVTTPIDIVEPSKPNERARKMAIIDTDIHNDVPSDETLYRYLPDRWRRYHEMIGLRGFYGTSYPRASRNAARHDAWPPSGLPPGSDLGFVQSQLLDTWDIEYGVLNCLRAAGRQQNLEYGAALARALLIQPSILLLDDSLSAVDTQTEKEILSELRTATGTTTTLVSAQRISSILHADRIYVLDQGRVAEEGTHDELLKINGLYAETYRLQLLSDELEGM